MSTSPDILQRTQIRRISLGERGFRSWLPCRVCGAKFSG
jgi:hypothetical protein